MASFYTADGAVLHYTERGNRGDIPLLFLHGWLGAASIWGPVMERLERRHRTLAVDLRGFGASAAAPGPYRIEALSDDLSALILAADLDPLVVIGHSMGAAIAQRFAIDRPDAVEGLVLIAPVPASGLRFSPKVDGFFRSVPGNTEATNRWVAGLMRDPQPDHSALLRAAAASVEPSVALENYESWTALDFGDEAATIDTPTLVIAPEGDRPEFAREHVANVIPGSRFEIVPDAGHYVPLEQPQAIAGLIERFIADL
jgi:pimeloyl-ACP methyl ester carboxylesterase